MMMKNNGRRDIVEGKNTYIINKLFTIPYIDKMIFEDNVPDSFRHCIRRYVKKNDISYGEAISEIYYYMNQNYRNEYFYKNTILNQLLLKKHDVYTTAALTELPVGGSKADFIMINGKGIVYEIKTDLDNFLRLNHQIEDYYKVFSYVNVVVSKDTVEKAKEFLGNKKVGIYELTSNGNLLQRRKAYYNREDLSYEAMFDVLRKAEFEQVLVKHFHKLPRVNDFKYYGECLNWMKKINIVTLQKEVMECLKRRTILTVDNKLEKCVPYELRFYAYFSKHYQENYSELEEFLQREVEV